MKHFMAVLVEHVESRSRSVGGLPGVRSLQIVFAQDCSEPVLIYDFDGAAIEDRHICSGASGRGRVAALPSEIQVPGVQIGGPAVPVVDGYSDIAAAREGYGGHVRFGVQVDLRLFAVETDRRLEVVV